MYEHRTMPPISRGQFAWRLIKHLLVSASVVAVFLFVGIWGYEHFEGLAGRDAFLNAAMILGGMGPIHTNFSPDGKIFAGLYALVSGLVFIAVISIMLTPVVHRVLHRYHWLDEK
jgi:hypothetical protein